MPEILAAEDDDEDWKPKEALRHVVGVYRKVEKILAGVKPEDVGANQQMVEMIEAARERNMGLTTEELRADVLVGLIEWVLKESVVIYIVVLDEEAFESGNMLLVWLDRLGRVVRSNRFDAQGAEEMYGLWFESAWHEIYEWQEGEIGEDYRDAGVWDGWVDT